MSLPRRALCVLFLAAMTASAAWTETPGEPAASSAAARTGVRDVAVGANHTCAVAQSGSVWCWGENSGGAIGDGTLVRRLVPTRVVDLDGPHVAVAVGEGFSCALSESGAVHCWGRNTRGQLGDGTTSNSVRPVPVRGLQSGVQAITAGAGSACAINAQGRVLCWGENSDGQLGDGSTTARSRPVRVQGLGGDVQAISAGSRHACALNRNGRAMCWGANRRGQLGDGTYTRRLVATRVAGVPRDARAISVGGGHSCMLDRQGRVLCWGWNGDGALGSGNYESSPLRVRARRIGTGAIALSALGEAWEAGNVPRGHTCAVMADGRTMCWGRNDQGQIGNGGTGGSARPLRVRGLSTPQHLAQGVGQHRCAINAAGRLMCWGENVYGQLGNDSISIARTPVAVLGALHRN
ncbi:MAG: RCC1 domain-containing protein [Roseinatronobacter sp.]